MTYFHVFLYFLSFFNKYMQTNHTCVIIKIYHLMKGVIKMNIIGNNIRSLRNSRGMTQQKLADIVGAKTYTTITKWEKGDNVPQGKDLIVLSNHFNVSVDSILGLSEQPLNVEVSEYKFYPDSISAGLPLTAEGITDYDTIAIPDEFMGSYAGHEDVIVSSINGDSMNKLMNDGSYIAIKPINLSELKNGDMVVFSHNHEYSVKYFYKHDDKLIFKPYSNNPVHYDQSFNADDGVMIHGKVVTYIVNLD